MLFLSCSGPTTKQESEYIQRQHIDRPYTLPQGLGAFQLGALLNHEEADGLKTKTKLNPILSLEQALTDSLTLEIPFLPTGLKIQLHRDDDHSVGLYTGYAFSYYGHNGRLTTALDLAPFWRYRLSGHQALDMSLGYRRLFGSNYRYKTLMALKAVFWQQWDPYLALGPWLGIQNKDYQSDYCPALRGDCSEGDFMEIPQRRLFFPLGISAIKSIDHYHDLEMGYGLHLLGYKQSFSSQLWTLKLVRYW